MTLIEILGIAAPTSAALTWTGAKIAAFVRDGERRDAALKALGGTLDAMSTDLHEHRLESRASLAASEVRAVERHNRTDDRLGHVEAAVDKLVSAQSSDRQVLANHDATLDHHAEEIRRIRDRVSGQLGAQNKQGSG